MSESAPRSTCCTHRLPSPSLGDLEVLQVVAGHVEDAQALAELEPGPEELQEVPAQLQLLQVAVDLPRPELPEEVVGPAGGMDSVKRCISDYYVYKLWQYYS